MYFSEEIECFGRIRIDSSAFMIVLSSRICLTSPDFVQNSVIFAV